jgi:hypothetical protein
MNGQRCTCIQWAFRHNQRKKQIVTNSSHFDYFQPLSCDIAVKTSTNHIAEAFKNGVSMELEKYKWNIKRVREKELHVS